MYKCTIVQLARFSLSINNIHYKNPVYNSVSPCTIQPAPPLFLAFRDPPFLNKNVILSKKIVFFCQNESYLCKMKTSHKEAMKRSWRESPIQPLMLKINDIHFFGNLYNFTSPPASTKQRRQALFLRSPSGIWTRPLSNYSCYFRNSVQENIGWDAVSTKLFVCLHWVL